MSAPFSNLRWTGGADGHLVLLDQTKLPSEIAEIECRTVDDVWEAIRSLRVRGAPAIGIAAAYGVVLGAAAGCRHAAAGLGGAAAAADHLGTSRPTAVNLFWALDRMRAVANDLPAETAANALAERLLSEAVAIHDEDRQKCHAIGQHGCRLLADLPDGASVLTHCNAGALATGGDGTALSVVFALHDAGKRLHVFADETRPLLQGARLTMWELSMRGIDATLICDSMAAHVMHGGRVQAVITGADRIAANGDVANKIGTYGLAVVAAAHGVPFFVAAPTTTFDLSLAGGDEIPIEERSAEEVTQCAGRSMAPDGVRVFNPAFDVTPARLIQAIICEFGVIEPVREKEIARFTERQ